MTTKKVSGGYPRVAQIMLLLFFVPFTMFLTYIIFSKNLTVEGGVLLVIFLAAISLVLKFGFSYADVYLSENHVIIKKLFTTRKIYLEKISEISESFFPFTYYIKVGESKVYFLPNFTDLSKQLLSFNPAKGLQLIKEKLVKENVAKRK